MKSSAAILIAMSAMISQAMGKEPLVIGSFANQTVNGWTYSNGREFPGAQGNMAIVKAPDTASGFAAYLEGVFGKGGGYVSFSRTLAKPLPFKGLSFKIKSQDYDSIKLRLIDGSGQIHQQTIDLKDSEAWQDVSVEKPSGKGYVFWGGEKDAKWHDPLKGITLMLSKNSLKPGLKAGKAYFAEIKLSR